MDCTNKKKVVGYRRGAAVAKDLILPNTTRTQEHVVNSDTEEATMNPIPDTHNLPDHLTTQYYSITVVLHTTCRSCRDGVVVVLSLSVSPCELLL